jgi:hypothetical protein
VTSHVPVLRSAPTAVGDYAVHMPDCPIFLSGSGDFPQCF